MRILHACERGFCVTVRKSVEVHWQARKQTVSLVERSSALCVESLERDYDSRFRFFPQSCDITVESSYGIKWFSAKFRELFIYCSYTIYFSAFIFFWKFHSLERKLRIPKNFLMVYYNRVWKSFFLKAFFFILSLSNFILSNQNLIVKEIVLSRSWFKRRLFADRHKTYSG